MLLFGQITHDPMLAKAIVLTMLGIIVAGLANLFRLGRR